MLFYRKYSPCTKFLGYTHYTHHCIDINRFVRIDDNGRNIGFSLFRIIGCKSDFSESNDTGVVPT